MTMLGPGKDLDLDLDQELDKNLFEMNIVLHEQESLSTFYQL